MAATTIPCSGCAIRLKVPEGRNKVRCPRCGTVMTAPDPGDQGSDPEVLRQLSLAKAGQRVQEEPEEVEHLELVEELEEVPERAPRRRDWDDPGDRPRPKRKARKRDSDEGPWLIAIGASAGGALIAFVITMIAFGSSGLADNKGQGGYPMKLACLFGAGCIGAVITGFGVLAVKRNMVIGQWGEVITGPIAIVIGFITALSGAVVIGFGGAAFLLSVILGH
jgi:LSD1 subclass zinc finger protein